MDRHDIVVIGASAGGFGAIRALISPLAADLPAALFLVSHLPRGPSQLADILDKACRLSVRFAEDGEPIRRGTLLIAPPDHHLLLQREHVMLSRGPRENLWRPSCAAGCDCVMSARCRRTSERCAAMQTSRRPWPTTCCST